MEDISRRDFIKVVGIGAGTFCLGDFFSSKIGNIIGNCFSDKESKTKQGFLKEKFKPLEFNGSTENSNFYIFLKILESLDEDIFIKSGVKLDFKNNTLTIPTDITYGDIPQLIKIIETKVKSKEAKGEISRIKNIYLNYSKALILKSRNSKLGADLEYAYKYYTLYSLFNGVSESIEIEKGFKSLSGGKIESNKDVSDYLKTLTDKEALSESTKIGTWKLTDKERKDIIKTSRENPKLAMEQLLSNIKTYIDSEKTIKNKESYYNLVRNILITTYKIEELLIRKEERYGNFILAKVLSKAESTINSNTSKKSYPKKDFNIDEDIQIEIKRSFEQALYILMVQDVSSFEKKIDDLTVKSIDALNVEYFKLDIFYSFLSLNFNPKEINNLMKGTKQNDLKGKIKRLPSLQKEKINDLIISSEKMLKSPDFKLILKEIKNKNYKKVQETLSKMRSNDKKVAIFCVSGIIGKGINSLLNKETEMMGNYNAEKFEIKNLKDKNGKLNCMTISALTNMTLEKIFNEEGKGIIFHKRKGDMDSHMSAAIEIGDEYIIIDSTFDEYYIKDKKEFDDLNTYDVDRFGNAYISGSYYNMKSSMHDKYLDSIIYGIYIKYVNRKKFDYLSEMIKENNTSPYSRSKSSKISIDE